MEKKFEGLKAAKRRKPAVSESKPYFRRVGNRKARGIAEPARNPPRDGRGAKVLAFQRAPRASNISGGNSTQEEWNCMFQKSPKPMRAKERAGESRPGE